MSTFFQIDIWAIFQVQKTFGLWDIVPFCKDFSRILESHGEYCNWKPNLVAKASCKMKFHLKNVKLIKGKYEV